jgi:RNA polymerase sigma-B factor
MKRIAVPPLSTSIQLDKYPSGNRLIRFDISLALFVHEVHHRCMHAAADPAADLVGRHLPLVRSLARRYAGRGEGLDDLVQVASLGLVAAARRYDPARGVPFVAYAVPTIDGELRRYLRDRCSSVRVPRREQECAAALRRAATDAAQRLGREASLDETADAAGISRERARDAIAATLAPAPLTALELRPSPDAEAEIESCEQRALVDELLEALDPDERAVIRLRFAGDLSQSEIAQRLGTSQSSVSRLLTAALAKLRDSLEPELRRSA